MCTQIPFCLGTDCKSLYDNCIKPSSTTKEKRVALDLLDVREGIERMGDHIRWVPTDHMLVDSLTKSMNLALLMKYLTDYTYSFKYDNVISETKRFAAKQRREARDKHLIERKARNSNTPTGIADSNADSEDDTGKTLVNVVRRYCVGFVGCRSSCVEVDTIGVAINLTGHSNDDSTSSRPSLTGPSNDDNNNNK